MADNIPQEIRKEHTEAMAEIQDIALGNRVADALERDKAFALGKRIKEIERTYTELAQHVQPEWVHEAIANITKHVERAKTAHLVKEMLQNIPPEGMDALAPDLKVPCSDGKTRTAREICEILLDEMPETTDVVEGFGHRLVKRVKLKDGSDCKLTFPLGFNGAISYEGLSCGEGDYAHYGQISLATVAMQPPQPGEVFWLPGCVKADIEKRM
jgi:hypothetical protein